MEYPQVSDESITKAESKKKNFQWLIQCIYWKICPKCAGDWREIQTETGIKYKCMLCGCVYKPE